MTKILSTQRVYERNGKGYGHPVTIFAKRPCRLEGCNGLRLPVRWKDGKVTYPCTRGLKTRRDGHLQIV